MLPIVLAVCMAGLIIGSYTDLRTREVPDWINYALVFAGFGIALIYTIVEWSATMLLQSVLGFVFFFTIAAVMYYTGQWGGGDSKMIMGIGALVGIPWITQWTGLPFLIDFIVYTIIVGATYGLVWSIVLAIINRKKFLKRIKKNLSKKSMITAKKALIISSAILILASFFTPVHIRIVMLVFALIAVLTFYLFVFVKTVEQVCMLKLVKPEQLTIGDWIAEDVNYQRKVIAGPKDLGIEKDQIQQLMELQKKGKITKVLIKEGIPFVPSFLIAFILSLSLGSLPLTYLMVFV